MMDKERDEMMRLREENCTLLRRENQRLREDLERMREEKLETMCRWEEACSEINEVMDLLREKLRQLVSSVPESGRNSEKSPPKQTGILLASAKPNNKRKRKPPTKAAKSNAVVPKGDNQTKKRVSEPLSFSKSHGCSKCRYMGCRKCDWRGKNSFSNHLKSDCEGERRPQQ